MQDDEFKMALEALQDISKTLKRHWMMDVPQRKQMESEATEKPAALEIDIEAGPHDESEELAEDMGGDESVGGPDEPVDVDKIASDEIGDDKPISIMSYGTRRSAGLPPPLKAVESPIKRGRGRPRKGF